MFGWLTDYWAKYNLQPEIEYVRERLRREQRILTLLEGIGFSWRIFFVAFLGFLASSWSLITVGIIAPALYYVYTPEGRVAADAGLVLDMTTLTATVLGMILFGFFADIWGRKALYGIELLIVLSSIGGAAFASEGYMVHIDDENEEAYKHSMDIYASLFWWRFALGLGIGAEYPMSGVIAAEFASTFTRGFMLAGIFLAQPIGRLFAYGIGLGVLRGLSRGLDVQNKEETRLVMDDFWRLILGLAGIPAILAIGLRFFIPETPRFFSAVKRDMKKAAEAITKVRSNSPALRQDLESVNMELESISTTEPIPWGSKARDYFFGDAKGWKPLVSISFQWLMLDVAFYGTGLDSPGTLNALWMDSLPPSDTDFSAIEGFGIWKEDRANPTANVTAVIENNLIRVLQLSSIPAIVGSIAVIPLVNYVSRKNHYVWTSALLTVLFAAMAITVSQTYATPSHRASMVLYALAQLIFNLGPNTLTFMLAAEAFPTEFRGTSFGLAAAFGKIGAIIIRPIIEVIGKEQRGLVIMLSIFSGILSIMTIVAWREPWGIAIPSVQQPRRRMQEEQDEESSLWERLVTAMLVNKSLEEIAPWPIVGVAEPSDSSEDEAAGVANGQGELGGSGGEEKNGHGQVTEVHGPTAAPFTPLPDPALGANDFGTSVANGLHLSS